MRIRSKLIVLIALPLLALGLITAAGIRQQSSAIEAAEDAVDAIVADHAVQQAVLAVGDERLARMSNDPVLVDQRQTETDDALEQLEAQTAGIAGIAGAIASARDELASARATSAGEAIALYSGVNDLLLGIEQADLDTYPSAATYRGALVNRVAVESVEQRERVWLSYLSQTELSSLIVSDIGASFDRTTASFDTIRVLVADDRTFTIEQLESSEAAATLVDLEADARRDLTRGLFSVTTEQVLPVLASNHQDWAAALDQQSIAIGGRLDIDLDTANRERSLLTLLTLIGAFVLTGLVYVTHRSITIPLTTLVERAGNVVDVELPTLMRLLGEDKVDVDEIPETDPIAVTSDDEIGDLVMAFNDVHSTALTLATEQAIGRRNVADMFINLGRRNQQLLQRVLAQLTRLEQKEEDPDTLRELFELDSAVTRMRRNAESLVALAGAQTPRQWAEPVAIENAVRGALGEVEGYERIEITTLDDAMIRGDTVADITHLAAELLENAIKYSEPHTSVTVSGHRSQDSYEISIVDQGIGMSRGELQDGNQRIAEPPPLERVPTKFLGLYVIGRLAERRGISVRLSDAPGTGVLARISLPAELLATPGDTPDTAPAGTSDDEAGLAARRPSSSDVARSPLEEQHDLDAELASMGRDLPGDAPIEPPVPGPLDEPDPGHADPSSAPTAEDEPLPVRSARTTVSGLPIREKQADGQDDAGTASDSAPAPSDEGAGRDDETTLPVRARRQAPAETDGEADLNPVAERTTVENRPAIDNSEKSAGSFSSMMSALSSGITRGLEDSSRDND